MVAVLGLLAAPAAGLNLGLPGDDSMPADSSIRKAYELRTEGFGEGSNGILQVAVDLTTCRPSSAIRALDALRASSTSFGAWITWPSPPERGRAGALLTAIPSRGPDNQATKDLVKDVRDARRA